MKGFDISGLRLPLKKTDEEQQSITTTFSTIKEITN
jgi:hypothetical protein